MYVCIEGCSPRWSSSFSMPAWRSLALFPSLPLSTYVWLIFPKHVLSWSVTRTWPVTLLAPNPTMQLCQYCWRRQIQWREFAFWFCFASADTLSLRLHGPAEVGERSFSFNWIFFNYLHCVNALNLHFPCISLWDASHAAKLCTCFEPTEPSLCGNLLKKLENSKK